MEVQALVDAMLLHATNSGYTVADRTLDLDSHVPSGPEATRALSIHPDNEVVGQYRNIAHDTLRVTHVTRLSADHTTTDAWLDEQSIRTALTGKYEGKATVIYESTVRGYHSVAGWYVTNTFFTTTRQK